METIFKTVNIDLSFALQIVVNQEGKFGVNLLQLGQSGYIPVDTTHVTMDSANKAEKVGRRLYLLHLFVTDTLRKYAEAKIEEKFG